MVNLTCASLSGQGERRGALRDGRCWMLEAGYRIANCQRMSLAVAAWFITNFLVVTSLCADPLEIATVERDDAIDFEQEILPFLRQNCLACHNRTNAEADLILEAPHTILKGGSTGAGVVAGNSGESLLLQAAFHHEDVSQMPPPDNEVGAQDLTPQQLGLLRLWIDQGAKGEVTGAGLPVNWQPLPHEINPVYAVAISPHGEYAVAGRGNQIDVYQTATQQMLSRLSDPALDGAAHLDVVQSLAFSPDGQRLASGGFRTIKIWKQSDNIRHAQIQGLTANVTAVTVHPTTERAAVGQETGEVLVHNLSSGELLQTLSGHTAAVTALTFNRDGTRLTSGSLDQTARQWNVADGTLHCTIATPAEVRAVALVANESLVATGGSDQVVRLWEPAPVDPTADESTAEENAESPAAQPVREFNGHTGPISALGGVGTEGGKLLSASEDGSARLWNVENGEQLRELAHGGQLTDLAVAAAGGRAVTASRNGTAILWNLEDGEKIVELKGNRPAQLAADDHRRAIELAKRFVENAKVDLDAANSRKTDEETNATKIAEEVTKAEEDLKPKVEAATKATAEKEEREQAVQQATAEVAAAKEKQESADEGEPREQATQQLAEAEKKLQDAQETLKPLVEAATNATNAKDAADRNLQAAMTVKARADELAKTAAEAVPGKETVHQQATEHHQQMEAGLAEKDAAVASSAAPVLAVAFAAADTLIAVATEDGRVHLFGVASGAGIATHEGPGGPVIGIAGDSSGLVAVATNQAAMVWDAIPEWELERTIGTVEDPGTLIDRVTALHFSGDGSQLASGGGEPSRSGELKIWNAETGELVRSIDEAHSDTVCGIEFSPDGNHIASGGADRFVKVFAVGDGTLVQSFEGHTHHVLGVSWRADGRILASSGADNVIKVWDFLSGDTKQTISGFGKEVTSIQFMGVSDHMVASCGDKRVIMKHSGGDNVRDFGGFGDFVYCARNTVDGKIVLAGGHDSILRMWREDGELIAEFAPPE